MEMLFPPLNEDQPTFPPNVPSYVPPGMSHGFAYGMSPFPDYGHFPAPYPAPSTVTAVILNGGLTMKSEVPCRQRPVDSREEQPRRRYRRDRYKFSDWQMAILVEMFEINKFPDAPQRAELVAKVGVDESRVQVWFKNRRAKERNMEKQEKREQRLNRAMRFNYREPEPRLEPSPFAYGNDSPAMPVEREFPEPSPYAPELSSALQSVKRELPEPICEETGTTYTELATAPPTPDQSVSSHPFSFDPFLYPYFMADASSSSAWTFFQPQP